MAIIPAATDLTRPYWDAARNAQGSSSSAATTARTAGTRRCRAARTATRPTSAGSEVSGTGTVYTYTVVRHATHAALADHIPYVIAIVELTEGPRIVTGITGCDPSDVKAGMEVRVRFVAVTDDVTLPYFEPASPS